MKFLKLCLLILTLHLSQNIFAAQPIKEWTMLIYMNGHNNLSSYAEANLRDIEKAGGSNENINFVVEWGSAKTNITKRLLVQKTTNASMVTSPTLMSLPDHDMGDYKNLIQFLEWGIQEFPARHYFVVVWNHGTGWHTIVAPQFNQNMNLQNMLPTDISFDDNTSHKITTAELGLALQAAQSAAGKKIDIYGSDACLMQMIEVASELKDSVDYVVGSQEVEPVEGWPYLPFIQQWSAEPNMSIEKMSTILSQEFKKSYSPGGIYREIADTTFSALRISELIKLEAQLQQLAQEILNYNNQQFSLLRKANISSTKFTYADYVDLGDLIRNIKKQNISESTNSLIAQVEQAYKDTIITTDNGESFPKATGLSIWMPSRQNPYTVLYDDLKFSKSTNWNQVVKRYMQ